MPRVLGLVALLLCAMPVVAPAQARRWEFGASAGGGPSVVTESWGGVPDHELVITTVYVAHPLIHWKGFSASWVGEILPAVVATKVQKGLGSWFPGRAPSDSFYVVFPHGDGPDFGVGATPVGFRFGLRFAKTIALFAACNGGAVAFARAMPNVNARSVNFFGRARGGSRFGLTGRRGFSVGF